MKTLYTGIRCPDPTFVHTPLIEIHPVAATDSLKQAASEVDTYDYLLFTSRYAVRYFQCKASTPPSSL